MHRKGSDTHPTNLWARRNQEAIDRASRLIEFEPSQRRNQGALQCGFGATHIENLVDSLRIFALESKNSGCEHGAGFLLHECLFTDFPADLTGYSEPVKVCLHAFVQACQILKRVMRSKYGVVSLSPKECGLLGMLLHHFPVNQG